MSDKYDNITAVLVTRGNVDMTPIVESLPFEDIIIFDNSKKVDFSVYGRYFGIAEAKNDIIYVQDDDCIVTDISTLVDNYEEGKIVANMPQEHIDAGKYFDNCLVGWGAIFDKRLPQSAFDRYLSVYPIREDIAESDLKTFNDTCDIIFTTLTPFKIIDVGHENFDYAYGEDRMYNGEWHDYTRNIIKYRSQIARGKTSVS